MNERHLLDNLRAQQARRLSIIERASRPNDLPDVEAANQIDELGLRLAAERLLEPHETELMALESSLTDWEIRRHVIEPFISNHYQSKYRTLVTRYEVGSARRPSIESENADAILLAAALVVIADMVQAATSSQQADRSPAA